VNKINNKEFSMRQAIQKQLLSLSLEHRINLNVFLIYKFAFWSETALTPPKFKGFPVDILMEETAKSLVGGE